MKVILKKPFAYWMYADMFYMLITSKFNSILAFQACKTSLRSEQKMQRAQISPVERAFAVIRDLYEASKTIDTPGVLLETAITKCIGKGIPKETLEKCVEEYSANGVLMVDSKQRIIFTT